MKLTNRLLLGGLKPSDNVAKSRALKISNMITLSAIGNTLVFSILFWLLGDAYLARTCFIINLIYCSNFLISLMGYNTLGRVLNIMAANIVLFYFGCIFRGQSGLEYILFSLSAAPFMFFSWEEKRFYLLSAVSIILLLVGEISDWSFLEAYQHTYDLKWVRVFSIFASIHQIIAGYFYFLKLSVKFENESIQNLQKLEIEHQKQIQVQKMSSLGEMASGISHEINNPLMVILGKTFNLKRELKSKIPENDVVFSHLDKIEAMVERTSKIIRALKNFSRNTEQDPYEKVGLDLIIDSTLDLCRERFHSAGIHLKLSLTPNLYLNCRPTEISQVLLNLLNNAFDALEGRNDGIIELQTGQKGEMIEILVRDNGSGIAPALRDKIMQPFFSTKDVGKGTGLGLSISKGLIESHDGHLNLETGPTTTFRISLPKNLNS